MPQAMQQEMVTTQRQLIWQSLVMQQLMNQVARVAKRRKRALIVGESGTGKELIARMLHQLSVRSDKPFVPVECSTISKELVASELFGHEAGAFTGARGQRIGYLESAHKGTVFLDEVSQIPLEIQPKLLRVLQEQEFRRVGGNAVIQVDVWVIAATNRDLEAMVKDGTFLPDLMYRLKVVELYVPALRERVQDIPLLVEHFLDQEGMSDVHFSQEAMEVLCRYPFPGNIRELQSLVESCTTFLDEDVQEIGVADLPPKILAYARRGESDLDLPQLPAEGISFRREVGRFEERLVRAALEQTGYDRQEAARFLRIEVSFLTQMVREFKIGGVH